MISGPKPVEVARESLAGVRSPAVALVVRGERPGLLDRLAKALPDAVITVLDVDAGMDAVHLALTAGRPWDLVLDVAAGKGTAKRWPVLLHHVRRGGNLAVRVPDSSRPLEDSVVDVAAARRAGAEPPTPGRDLRDNPERDLAALAASTTDLRVRDGWLRATSAVDTLAKVPEADGDAFLRARPSAGRTLTTVPGLRFDVALRPAVERPRRPAQRVRRPGGVAARVRRRDLPGSPGGVRRRLRAAGELSPPVQETAAQRGLRGVGAPLRPSARAGDRGPRRAGVPARHLRPRPLRARADRPARPSLGLAHRPRTGTPTCAPWCSPSRARGPRGLGAGAARRRRRRRRASRGRARADRGRGTGGVVADVRDARLRAPRDRHDLRRGGYRPGGALDGRRHPGPLRLFCSRRPGKRSCHNAAEVEALFAAHGFAVVFPEDHPLPEQVRMVRDADVVAGFAGSGMFQIAFAGGPEARDPGRLGVLHRQQRVPDLLGRRAPSRPGALPPGRAEGGATASPTRRTSPTSPTTTTGRAGSFARSWPTCETAGNKRRRPSVAARRGRRDADTHQPVRRGPAQRARPDPAVGDAGDRAGGDRLDDPGHGRAFGGGRPRRLLAVPVAVLDLPAGPGRDRAAVRQVRRPGRAASR